MIDPREIEHQKQPCSKSCFTACIAMLTGVPVMDVIEESKGFGHTLPLTENQGMAMLVKYDILPVRKNNMISDALELSRAHLVTVLNEDGRMHCVIVVPRGDRFDVFDPNEKYQRNNIEKYFEKAVYIESLYDCSGGIAV